MPRKFYIHEVEIDVKPREIPKGVKMVRYCESPMFTDYPGCVLNFSSYETELHYGTVKHDPNQQWYTRAKEGTVITCREMPLEYCANLIDASSFVFCPTCGQLIGR